MNAVFLDQATFSSSTCLHAIRKQVANLTCYETTTPNRVIERCQDAEIIITNKVIIDANMISALPKLQLICIAATGINNIDLHAARKQEIAVTNVSGYAKNSVAQYVFSQLLEYFSRPHHHTKNVEQGLWQQSPTFCHHGNGSIELAGKILALIGYGNLAKAVEQIALAFGMQVVIAERPNQETIRPERVSFQTALTQADIISLHCPLTPETENLIDQNALKHMKSSAVLINTARGGIVNEKDLLKALINKDIAYAIVDVLTQEPPSSDHILLKQQPDNLKITAHIAWASLEAQQRLLDLIGENIADFNQGIPTNRVDLS